jgi:predicted RNA-binding Zn-ribbon protein involved in translation (DUF1610 family)
VHSVHTKYRHMIPIWLHVTLVTASRFGGAFAAGLLANSLGARDVQDGWVRFAIVFPSLLVGWVIGGRAFSRLVVARCPRCGGPTRCEEVDAVQYRCQACGHLEVTGVRSEGD